MVVAFGNSAIGAYGDTMDADGQSVTCFTSTFTGDLTDIYAYVAGASAGNCKAAVYATSGGYAAGLLKTSNAVALTTSWGWVQFHLPTTLAVVSGTVYGLALLGAVDVHVKIVQGNGRRDGNGGSYAGGFADPYGALWFSDTYGGLSIYAVGGSSSSNSHTFTDVQANHTIYVESEINTYTITSSSGGNGSISPSGVTSKNYNTSQTYTFTPDSGYMVTSVVVDGVAIGYASPYIFSNIADNHTIAVFFDVDSTPTYTVIATAGSGGSLSNGGTHVLAVGIGVTITASANTGYTFTGWNLEGTPYETSPILNYSAGLSGQTYNFTAAFTAKTSYIIVASSPTDGGGTITYLGTNTVNVGNVLTFTATAADGYRLLNWVLDGNPQGAAAQFTPPTGTGGQVYTLTAVFQLSDESAVTGLLRNNIAELERRVIGEYCFEAGVVEPGIDNAKSPLRNNMEKFEKL